jgi:hypothetical protein
MNVMGAPGQPGLMNPLGLNFGDGRGFEGQPFQQIDPNSMSIGGRTGIAAYNGMGISNYQDPNDVGGFMGSKYYGLATGNQQSPWSKLAADQQGALASQQNASAKVQGQSSAAANNAHLAQQGGLTSGARERSQEQAGKNVLSMTQGNNQTAANNTANIGIEDAKQRQQMLGDATNKLTSMQAGNVQGRNQYNQNTQQEINRSIAANQTSEAQRRAQYDKDHSGIFGGGGFLGLGF